MINERSPLMAPALAAFLGRAHPYNRGHYPPAVEATATDETRDAMKNLENDREMRMKKKD